MLIKEETFSLNELITMDISESSFFKEFKLLHEEILKHKWFESERANEDVGFEFALIDWTVKHRTQWIKERKEFLKKEHSED